MNISRNKLKNIIGMICLLFGAGMLVYTTRFIFSMDIWFDELFTIELASKPVKEMWLLASADVHPPLYYIWVRGVYLIADKLFPKMTVIEAAKFASILPYYFVIIYAVTIIRKRFGWMSAGLTIVFVEMMPQMSPYMVEARMYSISLFVVLAMFLHGMEAVVSTKSRAYINLAAAMIYAICAMYLHYYAFIGAAATALCMLFYVIFIKKKKEEKRVKLVLLASVAAICLLAYIPWIKSMLSQVGQVSESYWIQPLTIRSLAGCLKFIFKPEFESSIINYAIAAVLIASITCLLARFLMVNITSEDGEKNIKAYYVLFSFLIPVILVLIGFVASLLVKPVFVYRYMLPAMGVFWMGVSALFEDFIDAVGASSGKRKALFNLLTIFVGVILLCTAIRDYRMFSWEENKKEKEMYSTQKVLEMIEENYSDTVMVCNFNQVQAILWHYVDNPSILYGETNEILISKICGRYPMIMTENMDEIQEYTENNHFLFVGSGNIREDIIADWEQQGMTVEKIADSCLLERYYFNVYNVSW